MKRNQFFSCKGIQMMLLAVMMLFGYTTNSHAYYWLTNNSSIYKKDYNGVHLVMGYNNRESYLADWLGGGTDVVYPKYYAVAGFAEGYEDRSFVTIPKEVDGIKVVAILTNAFMDCTNLTTVYFESGALVEIGLQAFAGCTNLSNINNGNYDIATSIGRDAFLGCTSLKSFTIHSHVKKIGTKAFYGSGLKDLHIYANDKNLKIEDYAFAYCNLTNIPLGNEIFYGTEQNQEFGTHLFAGNPVVSLSFGTGAHIPPHCFAECTWLTELSFSGSVRIGEGAFRNCTNLNKNLGKTLSIGTQVSSIGPNAFRGSGITTVSISNPTIAKMSGDKYSSYLVSRFGEDVTTVSFADGVTTIGERWAINSNVNKVTIPKNVTIGDNAFAGCKLTGDLQLTGGSIGNNAFANTYPSNVILENIDLAEGAFSGSKISNFTLNNNVTLQEGALDGLSVTTNLSVPNLNYAEGSFNYTNIKKLTVTGTNVSGDCLKNSTNINRVVFPNATSITGRVLEGSSVEWVAFPKLESISQETFGYAQKLYRFCDPDTYQMTNHVNNGHIKYTLGGGQGTVYSADGKTLLYVLPGHDRIYLDKDVEYIDLNGTDFKRENDVLKWGALVMDATAINHKIKLIGDPEQQACCRYLHIGLGCRKYFEDFTKMRYAPMLVQDAVQGDVNEDGKVSVADVMNVYDILK